jgi:hypothetical protein
MKKQSQTVKIVSPPTGDGPTNVAGLTKHPTEAQIRQLERFKKHYSHSGRGFLGFGEWCRSSAFGEGAGLKNPVTEPKRSQNPKRPPSYFSPTEWL